MSDKKKDKKTTKKTTKKKSVKKKAVSKKTIKKTVKKTAAAKPATKKPKLPAKAEPKIEAAKEPEIKAEHPKENKPKVKKSKAAKKTMKVKHGFSLSQLPDGEIWPTSKVDAGWHRYRLWTACELDWDEDADDDAIMTNIRERLASSKKALVSALSTIDKDKLAVKTNLKKDPFPYQAYIEAWIADKHADEVKNKLRETPEVFVIDPDFVWSKSLGKEVADVS